MNLRCLRVLESQHRRRSLQETDQSEDPGDLGRPIRRMITEGLFLCGGGIFTLLRLLATVNESYHRDSLRMLYDGSAR